MKATPSFSSPAREIPVLGTYDVVVCGGGSAGCAAAIAAARHGARTLLLEKLGYLGGATVAQQVSHVLSTNGVDFQGIWHEWIRAVRCRGGLVSCGLVGKPPRYRSGVDSEVVKYAWDDLLEEAGVTQMLHAWGSVALIEDGICRGVVAETCAGRRAILAARIVDCTADGTICASAGVPWTQGNGVDPWNQALTKVFRMGHVDWPKDGYSQTLLDSLLRTAEAAMARGEFVSPLVGNGRAARYSANNGVHQSIVDYRTEMNVFSSRVLRVNTLDPFDLTRAEREGREQCWQAEAFIRKYVPGFERAYLLDTNACIGVRDSRRVRGLATATDDDVMNLRTHDDGIAKSSWDIDIWPGESYNAPAVDNTSEAAKVWHEAIERGGYFDVRYGCIVASTVDNLLIGGRCISAERKAQASVRIQQTCQSTGQAAGTAAALSLSRGCTPRELDVTELIRQLAKDRDVEPAFPQL